VRVRLESRPFYQGLKYHYCWAPYCCGEEKNPTLFDNSRNEKGIEKLIWKKERATLMPKNRFDSGPQYPTHGSEGPSAHEMSSSTSMGFELHHHHHRTTHRSITWRTASTSVWLWVASSQAQRRTHAFWLCLPGQSRDADAGINNNELGDREQRSTTVQAA
jgi:hypothetical protein